jgi:RNA polymerase sigma-70 factor (ECF subfamily)
MNAGDFEPDTSATFAAGRQPGTAGLLETLDASVPALRRYAAVLRDDQHNADGLVHACLAAALDRLHARRDDADPRVWLFGIMHNVAMSRSRRGGVRRLLASFRTNADADPTAVDRRQDLGEPVPVIRALMRLPLKQRSVMFLVSVEELSYAAVAEVHGIPAATVISLLADGRDRLREIVGDGAPVTPRRTT